MRVTSAMKSTLTVTIKSKTDGTIISSWSNVAFDIKSVPTATFGFYSPDTDPLRTNDPGALLDAKNPTVPLAMGLKLEAPPPVLAASLIPPFSMADASRLGILDFRFDTTKGSDWRIEMIEPEQKKYIPSTLTPIQEAKSPTEKWADLATEWSTIATAKQALVTDAKDGLLAAYTGFLGWDTNRPQAKPGDVDADIDPAWRLSGGEGRPRE